MNQPAGFIQSRTGELGLLAGLFGLAVFLAFARLKIIGEVVGAFELNVVAVPTLILAVIVAVIVGIVAAGLGAVIVNLA